MLARLTNMLDRSNMHMPIALDLLDGLLNLGAVDGRLDERCELRSPWALENAGSGPREMPYHAVMAGAAVVHGPSLEPTTLYAGDILVLPSGEAHGIVDLADGAMLAHGRSSHAQGAMHDETGSVPTVLLCGRFLLSYSAWRLYRALLPEHLIVRANAGAAASATATSNERRLGRLLTLMKEETEQLQPGYASVLRNLSAALFGLTLRAAMHESQAPAGMLALAAHPRLRELAVRIVQTPSQAWTIEEMGEIANMSRSSLIRSFGAAAGMTPAEFVTRIRIAEASRLLKESEQSVAAVGEAVGYASEAAFQRAFKRETSLTPAAWRAAPPASVEPVRPPRVISIGGTPG